MEATQVQLRLTKDPELLNVLRQRRRLNAINVPGGRKMEVYTLQHDSFPFDFTPNAEITVGKNVARALRQSSRFIPGDHLTGEEVCAIVEVSRHDIGKGMAAEAIGRDTCPYCRETFPTPTKLGHHMMTACAQAKKASKEIEEAEAEAKAHGGNGKVPISRPAPVKDISAFKSGSNGTPEPLPEEKETSDDETAS